MLKKTVLGFFLSCAVSLVYADTKDEASVRIFEVQMKLAQGVDPAAQFHVGEMYEKGLGTDQDLKLAYAWYQTAAAQGHALAKEKIANWERIKQDIAKAKDDAIRAKQIAVGAAKAEQRAIEARAKQNEAKEKEKEREKERARTKQQPEAKEKDHAAAEVKEKERAAAEAHARQQAQEKEHAAQAAKMSAPAPAPPAKPAENKDDAAFSTNPCKGPSAKFLSTCQ